MIIKCKLKIDDAPEWDDSVTVEGNPGDPPDKAILKKAALLVSLLVRQRLESKLCGIELGPEGLRLRAQEIAQEISSRASS